MQGLCIIPSIFTAPMVYGDTAIINIAIKNIGGNSLVFTYSIMRKRDGMLFFEADAFTVFISLKTMKPTPITDEFRNLLVRYMEARNYICFILL